MEYKGDSRQALICIQNAAKHNIQYPDWKILLCRLLLDCLKTKIKSPVESFIRIPSEVAGVPMESKSSLESPDQEPALTARGVLEEAMQTLNRPDAEQIVLVFENLPASSNQIVLTCLSILPVVDVVFTCLNILQRLTTKYATCQDTAIIAEQVILILCRDMQRQIMVDGLLGLFLEGQITDYR